MTNPSFPLSTDWLHEKLTTLVIVDIGLGPHRPSPTKATTKQNSQWASWAEPVSREQQARRVTSRCTELTNIRFITSAVVVRSCIVFVHRTSSCRTLNFFLFHPPTLSEFQCSETRRIERVFHAPVFFLFGWSARKDRIFLWIFEWVCVWNGKYHFFRCLDNVERKVSSLIRPLQQRQVLCKCSVLILKKK